VFSYVSPFTYSYQGIVKLQLSQSEYPAAQAFVEFLDIKREWYMGVAYLVIEILVLQILAIIMLKVLISKFQ